jgi:RES domain-containing protein
MYGGRWNEPGTWAIYTAGSRSLAALETLANYSVLPRDFVMTAVRIPYRVKIQELD